MNEAKCGSDRQANRKPAGSASFIRTAGVATIFGAALALCGCGHQLNSMSSVEYGANEVPSHYKSDILAAMHVYLNDPTGIRDAAVSEPALKEVGGLTRYVACLKFNPKKNATDYAGMKEIAAVFLAGRFDHFVETPKELCAGAAYAPFPELQNLPP
jgi:hypothetical protein